MDPMVGVEEGEVCNGIWSPNIKATREPIADGGS